jgi:hypothetical protein
MPYDLWQRRALESNQRLLGDAIDRQRLALGIGMASYDAHNLERPVKPSFRWLHNLLNYLGEGKRKGWPAMKRKVRIPISLDEKSVASGLVEH